MFERLDKKTTLYYLIENGRVKNATILAKPTEELTEAYFNMRLVNLLKKYDIEDKPNKYGDTALTFYIPTVFKDDKRFMLTEQVMMNIKIKETVVFDGKEFVRTPALAGKAKSIIEKVIEHLMIEVFDYYQVNLNPLYYESIIDKENGYKLNPFEMLFEMLEEVGLKQKDIAKLLDVSQSLITEIKYGRSRLQMEHLAKLMKIAPLLPYDHIVAKMITTPV